MACCSARKEMKSCCDRINCTDIMLSERNQTKGHLVYDCTYMKCPDRQICTDRSTLVTAGGRKREERKELLDALVGFLLG